MPELPEVEVVCRGLRPLIIDHSLQKINCSDHPLRLPIPKKSLQQWVLGEMVRGVRRRAKYLLVDLENGAILVFHLGMTGKLGLFPQKKKRAKHDHLWSLLDNGMELRFNDTRRFGSVQVLAPHEEEAFFTHMGPEPLGEDFTAKYLHNKATRRKQPVKNFLMDSRVVVGIGNIYASEILYGAAISPLKPAAKLTVGQWRKIIEQAREVLSRAIAAGGSTIADFVGSSGEQGYFQLQLNVYGRHGKGCRRCGAELIKTVLAGRATFYCNKCQK